MPIVRVNGKDIRCDRGENLYRVLRRGGIALNASCGGRGTCGKCDVWIGGQRVKSCEYTVDGDLSISLSLPKSVIVTKGSLRNVAIDHTFPCAAVDIGTTTIAAYLISGGRILDAQSAINSQKSYGDDVITRIHYTMEHPNATKDLHVLIRRQIEGLVGDLCDRNGVRTDHIAVVGNPTMLHLYANISPESIGVSPFTPVFTEMKRLGNTTLLPSISGYVGADTVAAILASGMHLSEGKCLLIDIGTNGEIALGNKERILVCAAAAGPAFEGAQISCGIGCVAGAIDSVTIGGIETGGAGGIETGGAHTESGGAHTSCDICSDGGAGGIETGGVHTSCDICSDGGAGGIEAGGAHTSCGVCPDGGAGGIETGGAHTSCGVCSDGGAGGIKTGGAHTSCDVCSDGGAGGMCNSDPEIRYTTIGGLAPVGICGSAIIDITAQMLAAGMIDQTGYFEAGELKLTDKISFTSQDVRQVQLAKAAIAAGIDTLLSESGVSIFEIETCYLAGGFGSGLNKKSACEIGLIPNALLEKILPLGNAAGMGAVLWQISDDCRKELDHITKITKYFELSGSGVFHTAFIKNISFD